MSKDRRDPHEVKHKTAAIANGTSTSQCPVIVVGVGASAGGLESLKQLFTGMPIGYGVAFVLIQHMEGSQVNQSIEQLGALATMAVVEAADGLPVLADRIHVMPPDKFLSIAGSRLTLHDPFDCDGLRMPIDHFFCALAADQRRRGCGILLSGAGSDGILGLSEIKSMGGRTFVEDPGTPEFPILPQSAINAGVVDTVLPVDAMVEAIIAFAEHTTAATRSDPTESPEFDADLRTVLDMVRTKVGHDFRCYKPNTLVRRIRRRMMLAKATTYADYTRFLHEHPEEAGLLQKDLLIGVTDFFRQPQAWAILEDKVIAGILEKAQPGSEIRVWVPGCSTGKEAYSLAIMLTEQTGKFGMKSGFQIFATDSDVAALATARSGSYSEEDLGPNVSPERLKRFFAYRDGRYQVIKEIRERVVFAPQNLTADPPFSRLDLISCRNLLIYLDQQVQQKIIALFHFALTEGGFLFLGTAETVGDREDLFEPVSKRWRIYRRIGVGRPVRVEIPVCPTGQLPSATGKLPPPASAPRLSLASTAQQTLLDRFVPACVMIDRKLQVLYVHGPVEDYLTFPPGELSTRIVDMAREGLRARLRGAINKSLEVNRSVSVIARVRRREKSIPTKATVSPLRFPREADGLLLITFEDYRLSSVRSRRTEGEGDLQQLQDELKISREELQSSIDQLESSNDQLKASNEEVTAANEELQSANEELETSKEELQSLNEELNTINARLQEKVEELEGINNDVVNLLSSTHIATVFLDKELKVKRYTPAITRLLSLIPSDIGRPVADILCRVNDETLLEDARRVLADLTPLSKEVPDEADCWYIRRITPYRTQDDRIDGVVITFVDVNNLKRTEEALRTSESRYRELVQSANSAIIRWRADGSFTFFNEYAQSFFGYGADEVIGRHVSILLPEHESSGDDLTGLVQDIVDYPERYVNNINENICRDGRRVWMAWTNRPILDENGKVVEILAVGSDVTELKQAEETLRKSEERNRHLAGLLESSDQPFGVGHLDGSLGYVNGAFERLTGYRRDELKSADWATTLTPPEWREIERAQLEELDRTGRPVRYEKEYVRKDGTRVPIELLVHRVTDAQGHPLHYYSFLTDLTERKKAEETLRRYELLSTYSRDIILFLRRDNGHIVEANVAAVNAYGYSREELLSLSIHDLRALETRSLTDDQMAEADTRGILFETVHRCKDGSTFHAEVSSCGATIGGTRTLVSVVRDISERKRAQQALNEAHERAESLARFPEENPNPVMRVLTGGRVLYRNRASAETTGWAYEIGEQLSGPVLPVLGQAMIEGREIQQVLEFGDRFFSVTVVPIIREGYANIYGRDVTEAKRAEEALRESETRFRLLSETANRLLESENPQEIVNELCPKVMAHLDCQAFFNFLVDEQAGKLHLNACAGIPEEDARKIEWLDYGVAVCGCAARDAMRIVAEDIFHTPDIRTELVKSYGIQAYACHPLMARGHVIGTLSFGTRTRTRFSPPDLAVMKTVADQIATAMERIRLIGELQGSRDQLEKQVQQRTRKLRKANEVLQEQANLLDLAHDAILVRDLRDRVVYWSQGAETTYGWTRDEAQGRLNHELLQTRFPQPSEDIGALLLEEGKWEGELCHTTKNGSQIIVESRQVLQRNLDGEPRGVLEINRDITESRNMEKQLTRADRLSSLGQLSGGIAHEIRNPLQGINLFIDLLSDEDKFSRTGHEQTILEEIKGNIRRINGIIKRVLDFSRQSETAALSEINLSVLIEDSPKLWQSRMVKDRIKLSLFVEENLSEVLGDPIEIQQVLTNLVQNAVEAMEMGGTLSIGAANGTLSFDRKRPAIVIKVKDSGPGIPLQHQKSIFNPFFTTKHTGTGLGLAISHRIVSRHGGLISFESVPDGGTTFTVELPAAPREE